MQFSDVNRIVLNGREVIQATLNGIVVWQPSNQLTTPEGSLSLSHFDELDYQVRERLILSGDVQGDGDVLLI